MYHSGQLLIHTGITTMKKTALILIALNFMAVSAMADSPISSLQAQRYEGMIKTVCGPVEQITKSTKATFVNFDQPYPNQSFSAIISKSNHTHSEIEKYISDIVANGEENDICITGRIKAYKGAPNITIDDIDQIAEE